MADNPVLTSQHRPSHTDEVRSMFDAIAPTYDVLNSILSGGLHKIWEDRLVRGLPVNSTGRYLDLCTGTGALVPKLSSRCAEVVGADISPQMLQVARNRWRSISNVTWIEADAQALPFSDEVFDAISVAYGVRNLPKVELGLHEMRRVLKPGGAIGILEFGQPTNRVWRAMFALYSRYVIPLIGGLLSGDRAAYEYLPTTAAAFPCGEQFETLLRLNGFRPVKTVPLMGGVAFIYCAEKDA